MNAINSEKCKNPESKNTGHNALASLAIKHLTKLVSFNTCNPPKNYSESGVIDYLTQHFKTHGAKIEVFDYGQESINVLVTKGNPSTLFNFHLDTVPVANGWDTDPYKLMVTEAHAIGLGACDIKGAAAAMMACIELYNSNIPSYALLFSSDEEHGSSQCIKQFLKTKPNYKAVVVAEPTQSEAITAHRGIHTASLCISSLSGHSSDKRALSDNAIHQFSQWAIKAIDFAKAQEANSYQNLSGICLNIGKVEGGIKPNIIADQLEASFGIRPLPGQSGSELFATINQLQENTSITFKEGFVAPSLPVDQKNQSGKEVAKALGLPIGKAVNFWTEAALFSQAGYPSIVYGPGDIAQAHTANEWVEIKQLALVASNYKRILTHGK